MMHMSAPRRGGGKSMEEAEQRSPLSVIFGSPPRPASSPGRQGFFRGPETPPPPPRREPAPRRRGLFGSNYDAPEVEEEEARPSCGAAFMQRASSLRSALLQFFARPAAATVDESSLPREHDVLSAAGSAAFAERYPLPSAGDGAGVRRLFAVFDVDGDGGISRHEVRATLKTLGNAPSEGEADRMISQLDVIGERDGVVDLGEFRAGLATQKCLLYQALYARHKLSGGACDAAPARRGSASPTRSGSQRQRLSVVLDKATKRRPTSAVV
ncbi:hypothetical protein M885DRAFT_511488 [Pelagophyceae sp. CCMP2097]|nr:hypothetical protein M885DRAFT_511488 [Pelagophyceae sp. CCMP2097]